MQRQPRAADRVRDLTRGIDLEDRVEATGGEAVFSADGESFFYVRLDDPEPFWLTPDVGLGALRVLRTTYAQSGLLPDGTPL